MDWVYLLVSVNGTLYTVNAYRPVTLERRWMSGWSFVASWLTIELAWVHLAWQVASTAFFVRRGVLRSGKGKLGLLLNVASWAGLATVVWQSFNVRHEIEAAFADLAPPDVAARNLGWRRIRDVVYGSAAGQRLKLDVYEPAGPAQPGVRRPAIVQIHGGAWVFGDKRNQGLPLLKHLASQGWVGFNVNYRLSPGATFPDHLIDVKRAIAWVREHADEYHVDPDFVVVTGGSAGGHLAALVALTAGEKRYQPGFEEADTSVQAAVPFYGVYDFTTRHGYFPESTVRRFFGPFVIKAFPDEEPEKFLDASPVEKVREDAPPFLVIHGALDTVAPAAMARDFVAALRATSKAPVLYLELKGAQHAFEVLPSIRANQVVRAAERFLDQLHEHYLAGRRPEEVPAEELASSVDAETSGDVST